MDEFLRSLDPTDWENFCEKMLRFQHGAKNFWKVPDTDQGDLGIEFYTSDGTIYQCYFPEWDLSMSDYKKRVQKKIRTDLKKLSDNESAIKELLDDIEIDQWVLLLPEGAKSKDLLSYCTRKKKDLLASPPCFITSNGFAVKIESPGSFPDGNIFARNVHGKTVDIPIPQVSSAEKKTWIEGNSAPYKNIGRKSDALMGANAEDFKSEVVNKYIQVERYLDQLRESYPDVYNQIESTAIARLSEMKEDALFVQDKGVLFVEGVRDKNKQAFSQHGGYLSASNLQSLSFGYLSKWLAECYMDFKDG